MKGRSGIRREDRVEERKEEGKGRTASLIVENKRSNELPY